MWPFIGAEHYTSKYYFKNSNSEKISLLSKWLMNRKKKFLIIILILFVLVSG